MAVDQPVHRPGPLKQTNKPHKSGRHRTKGEIDNARKGKVSVKVATHKNKLIQRKEQRRNQANQIRKNKRDEIIAKKRQLGQNETSPFLVCILPLNSQIDPKSALEIIEKSDNDAIVKKIGGVTHIYIPRFKQRFSFIIPSIGHGCELNVLDHLKVCDTTLILTSASFGDDDIFDKWGTKMFNMMNAQGIPTPVVALMDLESITAKKKHLVKANVQRFISKMLPDGKLLQLDTNTDGFNLLRKFGGQKKNTLYHKANRPHLLTETIKYIRLNDLNGSLEVTGYLRGISLDVNNLIHISGFGDFQMDRIEIISDPYQIEKEKHGLLVDTEKDLEIKAIFRSDPDKQASLQRENIPDEMDAEQTWPTEEEILKSNQETKKAKLIKRIPKGMSDYQACWIPDVEEVESQHSNSEESISDEEYMACVSEQDSDDEFQEAKSTFEDDTKTATMSEVAVNEEKYDAEMDIQEEKNTLKKIKEAKADEMWPDEIDTPQDVPARERFEKYRGLESFRTSLWDPKENLPSDYARIFQFKNFDRTKKRIIKEMKEIIGATPGSYIKIVIPNVSQTKWDMFKSANNSEHLTIYGMLPHEQQMSVMNVVLKRVPDSEIPIKSKEKLIIQCGYRRFVVNPIFSQHTNGNKHKYERFFRPNTTIAATFFAPIQFPPAPILCFKENPDTTLSLVAYGSLLTCNPDRIILKRLVLSGHPFKINKKHATVRFMFYNKEDVEYFKPIKLRTKCGRMGHIKESLGTHGHMKCIFDGHLKSFDTVFLYLYKRIFPKWNYEDCVISCEDNKMQE